MSKLKPVIRHEYLTIVKQPTFWLAMIAIPAVFAGIIALNYFSNQSSANRIEELAENLENVAIVDESSLISEAVVNSAGLTLYPESEKEALRQSVQEGDTEALVVYPESIAEDRKYQIYLANPDVSLTTSVGSLADTILQSSIYLPLGDANIIALAQQGAEGQIITYDEGRETAGFNEYVVPGIFLVLFYVIFLFSIGYMLSSVSEEKENRSMEMVLTYVKSRDLIIGKLLAVTLVTFTQLAFFSVLGAIGFLVAQSLGNEMSLPFGISIDELVFDPLTIFFALSFLVIGFLLFSGLMTTVASIAPSSKEANNFATFFYIAPWVPFWFVMPILTDPENSVVRFLTYFPATSPVVAQMRNTVGNIGTLELWLVLGVMFAFMLASIWLAVKAFKLGALEFGSTIKLSKLFTK